MHNLYFVLYLLLRIEWGEKIRNLSYSVETRSWTYKFVLDRRSVYFILLLIRYSHQMIFIVHKHFETSSYPHVQASFLYSPHLPCQISAEKITMLQSPNPTLFWGATVKIRIHKYLGWMVSHIHTNVCSEKNNQENFLDLSILMFGQFDFTHDYVHTLMSRKNI